MGLLRLRTLQGYSWPALPDGGLTQVWTAYRELDRTQWLSPDELLRHQLAQLRTLLAHCALHVPYYRDLLASTGLYPATVRSLAAFRRLPVLTRRLHQEQFAHLTAAVLPGGTQPSGEATSSGRTGEPVRVHKTNWVQLWWCAFWLRDLDWAGIDPTGTLAGIVATGRGGVPIPGALEGLSMPNWVPQLQHLIEMGPSHCLDVRQDHAKQLAWLERIGPDYLASAPANLDRLAQLAQAQGLRLPRLRAIQAAGEWLTDAARARIETAFGVPVKNSWHCSEAGYVASPCPAGHGLHVHAENVLLEVLDDAGQPCAPGQTGRVVLTTLHNFRAPFLRYEVGDRATVGPATCPCGRGLPLLTQVHGKIRPLFRLADGRWKSSAPLAEALQHLAGHRQLQLVQQAADRMTVRAIADAGWTEEHPRRLRKRIEEFCEAPVEIDFQLVERLEGTERPDYQAIRTEVDSSGERGA